MTRQPKWLRILRRWNRNFYFWQLNLYLDTHRAFYHRCLKNNEVGVLWGGTYGSLYKDLRLYREALDYFYETHSFFNKLLGGNQVDEYVKTLNVGRWQSG